MRIILFFSTVLMSVVIAFSSLSDVRAESQESNLKENISQNFSVDYTEPVHQIIEKQLRAFREYDAEKAYGYNSNAFKERYQNKDHFMLMMRLTYKPLTSHLSYTFLDVAEISGRIVQKVEMMNKDGSAVIMMVYLKQNDRGTWLIDGYTLLDSEEAQPI